MLFQSCIEICYIDKFQKKCINPHQLQEHHNYVGTQEAREEWEQGDHDVIPPGLEEPAKILSLLITPALCLACSTFPTGGLHCKKTNTTTTPAAANGAPNWGPYILLQLSSPKIKRR
jgi:hypothetical protein